MKWIKFKYILLLIILMAMVSTMACKTKTSGETRPKLYYTIEGIVKNPAGNGVNNVRVEVTDYVMKYDRSKPTDLFATLTDSDGAFTLEIISNEDIAKVTLQFSKTGSTNNYQNVGVLSGTTVTISALIADAGSFQVVDFNATAEDTITVASGGASVTIKRDTLVNAAGASVSTAQVSVGAIDTTADRTLLPGSLYGVDGSSVKLFSTFGMIEIQAIDNAEGDPVYLKNGATAAISIPVGEIVGPNPSATVGLWYYNEESATWTLQSNLTLNDAKTAYVGNVTHFSIFNAGESWALSFIKIRVTDQAGDPVYGAKASFFTGMFSNSGIWQEDYTTGPEGYLPSILSTELEGIVPDDMAGYLPLPANTDVSVRIKYIKTSDSKKPVFLFPDKSVDPDGKEDPSYKYELIVTDPDTGEIVYVTVTDPDTGEPVIDPDTGEEKQEYVIVDQEDIPTPYTFTTAAAGEITPFNLVALQLETAAFLTGHVKYENGDPATGWLRFMTSTDGADQLALAQINSDGDLEWVKGTSWPFTYTYDKTVHLPPKTEGFMIITTGPPTAGVEYLSWFVNGGGTLENYDDYEGDNGGPGIAKLYTSGIKGSNTDFQITLKGGGTTPTTGGDTEVAKSYVSGTVKLANGNPAPEGSWLVFKGMSSNTSVVIRTKIGADGSFPDLTGPFDSVTYIDAVGEEEAKWVPVTAMDDAGEELVAFIDDEWVAVMVNDDGELQKLVGEEWVTIAVEAKFAVELLANLKYTNTEVVDVTTDPLNPDVLFTYNYEAKGKDDYSTVVIGPNTTVSGRVYYNGGIGDDLLVTFTKVDAVTECITDTSDPDYDEDCVVDEPVTATTDQYGAYSVNLEIGTDYIVTVSTHDGDTPLDTLKTFLYTSNDDASDYEGLDTSIGTEYREVWTVTGKVSGNYDAGVIVSFTPVKRGDTESVITDEDGNYSVDLALSTDYIVTVETYDDTEGDYIVVYPTEEIPHECVAEGEPGYNAECTGTNFVYTSGDTDSNITGEGDTVNLVVGVKAFIPFVPEGFTAIYGTITNASTGAAVNNVPLGFSETGIFDIVNDVIINSSTDGIINGYDLTAATYGATSTVGYALLKPNTTYTLKRYRYNGQTYDATAVIGTFTSGSAGEVQELHIVHNTATTTEMTQTFIKGTVKDADGTPVANSTIQFIPAEGDTVDVLTGATGKFDESALKPNTEYSVSVGGTTIISSFTSEDAGVLQTLRLVIPDTGEITQSWVTGLYRYDDEDETPVAIGQNVYFRTGEANNPIGIIGDENGAFYTRTYSGGWVSTGGTLQLTPGSVYSGGFIASGVTTEYFTGLIAAEEGVVLTISIPVPAPEVTE